jgi:hypothetical protein
VKEYDGLEREVGMVGRRWSRGCGRKVGIEELK